MTNKGRVDVFHVRYTVMNLQRTQINPNPEIKKGIEILHAGGQKFVCVRGIHDLVGPRCKGLLRIPLGEHEVFPYPWE